MSSNLESLKKAKEDATLENARLQKEADDRKTAAAASSSSVASSTVTEEEQKLLDEIAELHRQNREMDLAMSDKSQGSKTFHDVDGRVYFLFDYRGASDRADASLCFRRMMAIDRQKLCMSGQRLDIDAEKLKTFLWGSADQSYFRDGLSATSTWGSAMQLDQVSSLPVFLDDEKLVKFLAGKWKRYDFAHLSLRDFFLGNFDEASMEDIRLALNKMEITLFCVFGSIWRDCNQSLVTSLFSSVWRRRHAPYIRFVLENFFCDFYNRMSAEYVPETGEPKNLLTQENVVALYAKMAGGVEVSADHESSWDRKFKAQCQVARGIKEASPGGKRKQSIEADGTDAKKAKVKDDVDKRLCLRNTFAIFKIGVGPSDEVPECSLKECKFRHVTKSKACPETLETQMKAIKNKWFTEGNMKALVEKAKRSFKG